MSNPTFVTSAGKALAASLKAQELFIAVGTGDADWEPTPPDPELSAVALIDELARKKVVVKSFVVEDEEGEIEVDGTTYSESEEPTNLLYIRMTLDEEELSDGVIREIGVFQGTEVDEDTDPGQLYFEPEEITDGGILVTLKQRTAIFRNAATKQEFALVLQF